LSLDYKKNGNIEKATWKTTYHAKNPTTSGYSIIVGAGRKGRVYLHEGNGTKASLPLSTFLAPPKSQ